MSSEHSGPTSLSGNPETMDDYERTVVDDYKSTAMDDYEATATSGCQSVQINGRCFNWYSEGHFG